MEAVHRSELQSLTCGSARKEGFSKEEGRRKETEALAKTGCGAELGLVSAARLSVEQFGQVAAGGGEAGTERTTPESQHFSCRAMGSHGRMLGWGRPW